MQTEEEKPDKLTNYFNGNGIDLSEEKHFDLKNIKHLKLERNGLFSLKGHFKPESLDFIYIGDLAKTKFYPIILKEILYYCKVNGFIILKLNRKRRISFDTFLRESKKIFQEKGALRKQDRKNKVLIFQKTKKSLEQGDSIDKWTFGIITDGKKIEQVKEQIESIRELKIPKYEIIICGKYEEKIQKDTKYMFFEYFDKGWITAQKNKILENAKYENVVVMHDRIVPNKDFYTGMKKYGNYFEVLSCKITNDKNERCGDWMTNGNSFNKASRLGLLDYKDWDKDNWIDGGFYILKKDVWRRMQWDESLFWNQGEDMKLTKDWMSIGIIPRFNPLSSCKTLSWRHGEFPKYQFNSQKLGRRQYSKLREIKDSSMHYLKKFIKIILGLD